MDDMHLTLLGQFGRMKMCHMTADTEDELHAMADRIGIARKWHQYPGTLRSHYDIAMSKRTLAIAYGAKEITMRETAMLVRAKKMKLSMPREDEANG